MEEWKDIYYYDIQSKEWVDFRGLYQVSNYGNVKSLNYNRTDKAQVLKSNKARGYLQVRLCKDGKLYPKYVHRLVAYMFISNPQNLPEVNHIDENKSNNHISNLEWCDRTYNNSYSHNKSVIMLDKNTNKPLAVFDSQKQASQYLGKDKNNHNIGYCANNKQKTAYGYRWKYINIIEL